MSQYNGHFCCAPGCDNSSGKDKVAGTKRSYYCIPKDEKRRKLWAKIIPWEEWKPRKHTRICSDHFPNGKAIPFHYNFKILKHSVCLTSVGIY